MLCSLQLPPDKPTVSEPVRTILVMIVLVAIVILAVRFAIIFADIAEVGVG